MSGRDVVVGHVDGVVDDVGVGRLGLPALDGIDEDGVGRGFVGEIVEFTGVGCLIVGDPIGGFRGDAVAEVEPDAAFAAGVVGGEIEGVLVGELFDLVHFDERRVVGARLGHAFGSLDEYATFFEVEVGWWRPCCLQKLGKAHQAEEGKWDGYDSGSSIFGVHDWRRLSRERWGEWAERELL